MVLEYTPAEMEFLNQIMFILYISFWIEREGEKEMKEKIHAPTNINLVSY